MQLGSPVSLNDQMINDYRCFVPPGIKVQANGVVVHGLGQYEIKVIRLAEKFWSVILVLTKKLHLIQEFSVGRKPGDFCRPNWSTMEPHTLCCG